MAGKMAVTTVAELVVSLAFDWAVMKVEMWDATMAGWMVAMTDATMAATKDAWTAVKMAVLLVFDWAVVRVAK